MTSLSNLIDLQYSHWFNQLFLNRESSFNPKIEAFRLVAPFLDISSTVSLMRVNKRLYKILDSNLQWKRLFFNYVPYPTITEDVSTHWKPLLKKIVEENRLITTKNYKTSLIKSPSFTSSLFQADNEIVIYRNLQSLEIYLKTKKITEINYSEKITSACLSLNKKLAVGDQFGNFKVLDLETEHVNFNENSHTGCIERIFSISKFFVSVSKNSIQIWSEKAVKLLSYSHRTSVWKVKLIKDKVISSTRNGQIFILNIKDLKLSFPLILLNDSLEAFNVLKLYKENDLLIAGSMNGEIISWITRRPYKKKVTKIDSSKITHLTLSGSLVFACTSNRKIICLNISKQEILFSLNSRTNIAYLKPIGYHLISLSEEGSLTLWNLKQKKIINKLEINFSIQKILFFSTSILFLLRDNSIYSLTLHDILPLSPAQGMSKKRKREDSKSL